MEKLGLEIDPGSPWLDQAESDRNGALHRCHDGGKLQEGAVANGLVMRPPRLAATGSMAARCSRKARAVSISSAPISPAQPATSAARIAASLRSKRPCSGVAIPMPFGRVFYAGQQQRLMAHQAGLGLAGGGARRLLALVRSP
jgi:hypothetical protein